MLDDRYQSAVAYEMNRLEIARKWAQVNKSSYAKEFDKGREDRIAGRPCRSANGGYLDGWYSTCSP